jgi:glycosyltransferase involved in cell wall biosynthesis
MTGKAILFYNDSEVFGGHEIMTVRIMNSLANQRSHALHCLHYAPGFIDQLDPSVITHALPFHTKTRTPFMPGSLTWQTTYVKKMIENIAPDLVVVSQGYAESGVRGLLAARRARVRTCSYIPFGNHNTELNNRFARLRDFACRFIYRLPDGYITISSYQASLLRRFTRAGQDIRVINNPADFGYAAQRPNALYAPGGRLEIAVAGRIVFKQKNQGALIPMARVLAEKMDFRIHIIGDGPDRGRLEDLITDAGLAERFVLHGWMQKPELVPFLAGHIDLILIPSLYEGLPLILLEALYLNKPFLMSDLGLLGEYDVPRDWLFDPRDPEGIARRIAGMGARFDPGKYAALRARVLALHSSQRFHAEVAAAFDALLARTDQIRS